VARRNPPWRRDELILALDLYFRHRPDTISKAHQEVGALSDLLNRLPIRPDRPDQEKFRNVNGTYMKLRTFLAFDADDKGRGLTAVPAAPLNPAGLSQRLIERRGVRATPCGEGPRVRRSSLPPR
jgi:hypothetical protein